MRSFRVAVVAVAVGGAFACNALSGANDLDPTLQLTAAEGGSSSSGSTSSSSGGNSNDGGTTTDASTDAQPFDAGKVIEPIDLVDVGAADKATGFTGGRHLVWAPAASRWVLFYVSSAAPTILRSKISSDFVTWIDGTPLTMPLPNVDGRNFAVTRATLGGKDVFHVALSFRVAIDDHRAYVARAVLTGETFAWNTPTEVTRSIQSQADLDPDGPAIAISGDGFVTLFTGYRTNNPDGGGTGNAYVLRASVADDGVAAFTPTWTNTTIEVVPTITNARAAVPIGTTDLLHVYENGDTQPVPKNLRWSRSTGAAWSSELSVFPSASPLDIADWSMLRVADTDVHVVRRTTAGSLEHRRYDGNAVQAGGAIADEVLETGAGIALVPLGAPSVMLGGVASNESIRATTWNGSAWSAWSSVIPPPASATRRWLIAEGAANGPSAFAWTENRGTSNVIAGVRIR